MYIFIVRINHTMQIKYGILSNCIDVTSVCYEKLLYGKYIIIPAIDTVRAFFFGDPLFDVVKSIFITIGSTTTEYNSTFTIFINIEDETVIILHNIYFDDAKNLLQVHSQLTIRYGSMMQELNEQLMAIRYLRGTEKILELGGNIGRNSLLLSSIMKRRNNNDLVVLESDPNTAILLRENRDINNLQFHIEPSALSKRKLIQKGWQTILSDELLDGYIPVNTITYSELTAKYGIQFNTLIIDCEGAFYYILMDMPEILDNIRLIIMENDYTSLEHKEYVDSVLRQNEFYVDYVEPGGWGPETPCIHNFYEVWVK